MTSSMKLQAPFPWFGGKSRICAAVWRRFGDVPNYVEPFFGSGAMLLGRPHYPWKDSICRCETLNDYDGHVANFWRAVQHDPEAVAAGADRIVHELDLHAIGDRLYVRPGAREFVERMRADETYYDAEWAGAWAWFVSNWIGGLPSVEKNAHRSEDGVHRRRPHLSDAGQGVSRKRPHMGGAGQGVSRQRPNLGNAGRGVARQRPNLGNAGRGECARRRQVVVDWMQALCDRLRNVRCCCGDWSRVCGDSVTWNNATPCAVFLDPPYLYAAGREESIYTEDHATIANDVREWAIEAGRNRDMRIALCGYEGEHVMPAEWECLAWKAGGGYANQGKNKRGRDNVHRERVWFSPGCLRPARDAMLWDHLEDEETEEVEA